MTDQPPPSIQPPDQPRELDEAAAATWAKLLDVQAQLAPLRDLEAELKNDLRGHLGRGRYTLAGEHVFNIEPTRRFSPAQAEKVLPADVLGKVSRPVVDSKLFQQRIKDAEIDPAWYALCQIEVGDDTLRPTRRGKP